MQNRHLTLVIPQLFNALAGNENLRLPALNLLLSRADKEHNAFPKFERLLFSLFGLKAENELPIAALTGLAEGLPTHEGYWLRADPVQLQIDLSAVYLLGNEHVTIQMDEIADVIAHSHSLLLQDNITLYVPTPNRWYLQTKEIPAINTFSPDKLMGKNISAYLPYGLQQTFWRKLQTELQMLLNAYCKNPQLNGIWIWGVGCLPADVQLKWRKIFSDNLITDGLTQLMQLPLIKAMTGLPFCMRQMEIPGEYLAVISTTPTLNQLEQHWFKPLVEALRKRYLSSVTLYLGNDKTYCVNAKNIRYFWRLLRTVN